MKENTDSSWSEEPIESKMERAQTIPVNSPIEDAIKRLQDSRSHCLCVVHESGELAGIFTEEDVVNKVLDRDLNGDEPVVDFIDREPYSLQVTSNVKQVIDLMGERVLYYLPLCDKEMKPKGIFSIRELIHTLSDKTELKGARYVWSDPNVDLGAFQQAIIEVLNLPVSFAISRYGYDQTVPIGKKDSVQKALDKLKGTQQRAALVYDEGDLAGLFRVRDVPFRLYHKNADMANMPVGELMTSLPKEVSEDECLAGAFKQMSQNRLLFLHHKTAEGRFLLIPAAGLLAYLYAHIHDDI